MPIKFIEDQPQRIVVDGVAETIPGDRHETRLDTFDQKLKFLRRNGCLIKDKDAQEYCAKYYDYGEYIDIENSYYEITTEPKTGRQYWNLVFTSKTDSNKD